MKNGQQNITRNKKQGIIHYAISILITILFYVNSIINAQTDSSYAFIVAGHAYGSHSGENIGLHPALLYRLDSGFDSSVIFIVFTGDIVNLSTTESWQQVEDELEKFSLPYYYVMGNHDANDIGWQVFEDKFGGTYYTFYSQNELFIVLNSTENERSISPNQITFLSEQLNLAGDTIQNIFIFFHEILWNSHEKYIKVRSNGRSRYSQIVNYSNYWEEVHPLLLDKPEKNFFLITGDVGGNFDAIAAFYDKWENITFISSGMGEVEDENYLLVQVHTTDPVEFELIPLNDAVNLDDIENYSIPSSVDDIIGPTTVEQGSTNIEYSVPKVFNADSYIWELPEGVNGTSTSKSILLDFDPDFKQGNLSVKAARDGFGTSPATSLMINANITSIDLNRTSDSTLQINLIETTDGYFVGIKCNKEDALVIRIFDSIGRVLKSEKIEAYGKYTEMHIGKQDFSEGVFFLYISTQTQHITKKIVIR